MPIAGISQGLGYGCATAATASGSPAGGGGAGWVDEYSVVFDGTDSYVSTGEAFDTLWTGSFTISLWYKTPSAFPTSGGLYQPVMNFMGNAWVTSGGGKGNIEFRLQVISSTEARVEVYFSAAAGAVTTTLYGGLASSDYLAVDTWYHLCWTANRPASGTTLSKLYIDGTSVTLSTSVFLALIANSGWTASNNTQIGARNVVGGSPPAQFFLEGHLDELAFFNYALTAGNVATIANAAASSGSKAIDLDEQSFDKPEHWWRMGDGDTFPTILDNVGSVDMTMNNMTAADIVSDVP